MRNRTKDRLIGLGSMLFMIFGFGLFVIAAMYSCARANDPAGPMIDIIASTALLLDEFRCNIGRQLRRVLLRMSDTEQKLYHARYMLAMIENRTASDYHTAADERHWRDEVRKLMQELQREAQQP